MATISNALSQTYVEALLNGNRVDARKIITDLLENGAEAYTLLTELVWPTMETVQELYREDRISMSSLNLATRLNRTLSDQLSAQLVRKNSNSKKVLIFCGDDEPEELGGQICADLFECDGWNVRFADPAQLHRLDISASYSWDNELPSDEKPHVNVSYETPVWRWEYWHNGADFYDLFGPTKRSRKGDAFLGEYNKALIFDDPRRLDL
jgi:hypothetical protein